MTKTVVQQLSVILNQRCIIEAVHFTLLKGDYLALIGPNGAGKSVLIKTLLGIYPPATGSIEFYDENQKKIRPKIGYVPQTKSFDRNFPAIGIELVISGLTGKWPFFISKEQKEKALAILDFVNAKHLANKSLKNLSGGELQRLYLARSLIQKPDIIIYDEPATGLDTVSEDDLHDLLEDLSKNQKITLIVATHDLDVARFHASHTLILNHGQIAFGKTDQSLNNQNLKKAYGHNHPHH